MSQTTQARQFRKSGEKCDYCYVNRVQAVNFRRHSKNLEVHYMGPDMRVYPCTCSEALKCIDPACAYSLRPWKD